MMSPDVDNGTVVGVPVPQEREPIPGERPLSQGIRASFPGMTWVSRKSSGVHYLRTGRYRGPADMGWTSSSAGDFRGVSDQGARSIGPFWSCGMGLSITLLG
jgi:hypothetical protein